MKAIVQDRYGSPDVLQLGEIDEPEIGDDEVLIRVHAAGLDRGVWHEMTGLPYFMRVMGFGLRRPTTLVRGNDVAGRVEAVGRNVTRWQTGDEVFGFCAGSFAELAAARADRLARKPENLSLEQAATVPTSALTALQGIRDHAQVEAGQRVLILGASGGVGSFAVQIAKAVGAEVTGVCSTAKMDFVRSIGADHVIDYGREDFAQTGRRYDAILDIGGNRPLAHLRRALAPTGTLVIIGGEEGGRWFGGLGRPLLALALSPLVRQRLKFFVASVRQEDLEHLSELLQEGTIRPTLDRSFPLSQSPDALRYLEQERVRGKIAITVEGSASAV